MVPANLTAFADGLDVTEADVAAFLPDLAPAAGRWSKARSRHRRRSTSTRSSSRVAVAPAGPGRTGFLLEPGADLARS